MMETLKFTYTDIENIIKSKVSELKNTKKIDGIIGIARGGMVPATIFAYQLNVPLYCVSVSSYNNKEQTALNVLQLPSSLDNKTNILVIDDINDTGKTFSFINSYLKTTFRNINVEFLSIFAKEHNEFPIADYCIKVSNNAWIEFPWE